MNAADRSELLQVLQRRCDTIAGSWYQAIAGTSQVDHSAAEVRQHLAQLTEQAIALLLANPLEDGRAEAIGTSLARLRCVDPEVLGRTQELLAQQFVEGLPADQVVALQPRLATLLGGLAAGFFQQTREAILAEQEQINEELQGEIAERRRAEKALRESEQRFQQVAENAQGWIWEVDARGLYTYASPVVEKIVGYEPEEIVGKKHFYELFHPEDREELKKAAFEVFAQKQSFREFTNRNVREDGETIWLSTGGVPILDEEGNLLGYRGADTDITERKRAEEALRKAHAELERRVEERTADLTAANKELLRSREEIVHNHDLLLALSQATQTVQRARTPEEVCRTIGDEVTGLGYHVMVFTLADDREHVTLSHATFGPDWLRKVEELSGLSVLGFRFRLARDGLLPRVIAEGESAFCEQTAELVAKGIPELARPLIERLVAMLGIEKSIYAPLRVSGDTRGLLGVASTGLTETDVPAVTVFANQASIAIENARLLAQVAASREQLRQLARQTVSAQEDERRRLSRALHDEAGQALTALRISLELIQEDLPAESGSLRQRIGGAAALTGATMEQIRLLAQDLRPPALDAVGLGPTLEGFCRDFAQRTQLPIDYLGLELPMLAEPVNICLYRFLQEALTNVAKHARANQVCVALRYGAETVSLSVEDDGRGFDRQARLSVSGWPMGIGLLGMQERLESLGGQLEIESRPGQGTRLVAHLPAGGTL